MDTSVEVIGVYAVKANEPVHLVELLIKNSKGPIEFEQITQEVPGQPKSNWQVPYDEKVLDNAGTKIVAEPFIERNKPELWQGDVRLIFYFHYLDLSKQLITPFGNLTLPTESEKPLRLSGIKYEAP